MKKLIILLFSILISFNSYGGIGDKYFCEEKESELGYEKAKVLITWNEDSVSSKYIKTKTYAGVYTDEPFVLNKNNYFVASSPYKDGFSTVTFDSETLVTIFIRYSHTYIKEYICTKL